MAAGSRLGHTLIEGQTLLNRSVRLIQENEFPKRKIIGIVSKTVVDYLTTDTYCIVLITLSTTPP